MASFDHKLWASLLALGLVAAPVAAHAQDEGDAEASSEASTDDAAEAEADAPAEEAPAEAAPASDGAPFPRISDDEETIYAVQRKAFLVGGKFELTPLFTSSFSDRFVQTFGFGGSVVYHLSENFGLELQGVYLLPDESSLTTEILQALSLQTDTAKLTQMLWATSAGVQWSPIYGKLEVFGEYLGNFNFYLGAGVGIGQTRVQCNNQGPLDPNRGFPADSRGEVVCNPDMVDTIQEELPVGQQQTFYEPNTFRVMGALTAGFRFHFSTWLALKFEVKDYIFAARVYRPESTEGFSDAIRNNIFAQVGVSFLLGGDED